jgi:hypothetical protein
MHHGQVELRQRVAAARQAFKPRLGLLEPPCAV